MNQSLILLSILLLFFSFGVGSFIGYLIKKLESFKRPKSPLNVDKKKLKEVKRILLKLSFEEKLFFIWFLMGSTRILLHLDEDGAVILSAGDLVLDDRENITG